MFRGKTLRTCVTAVSAAIIFVGLMEAPAQAAVKPVVRYASPKGKGKKCTNKRPCSLSYALKKTRAATAKMRSHQIIRLKSGVYRRTTPINLDAKYSGRRGFQVRIEAAPRAKPVISGGRVIKGWKLSDSRRNIWSAPVPRGFNSRQLFVNGKRADLASEPASKILGTMRTSASGYTTTASPLASWRNIRDVEFVYPAGGQPEKKGDIMYAPWSWSMCGVSSASGRNVTMKPACWRNGRVSFSVPLIANPTRVQNHLALLNQAGEFYLDKAARRVYYKPRAGQNMKSKKTSAIMPQAKALINAYRTSNLRISGITFEHATWIPNASLGVVGVQANVIAGRANFNPESNSHSAVIPSALSFRAVSKVTLQNSTIRRVGTGGVAFWGGGSNNVIQRNTVSDTSSNGITVSEGLGLTAARSYETNTVVQRNKVTRIGVEYLSAVGIMAGWVKRVSIRNNNVWNVPHVGISLGWGWMHKSDMVDNHIDKNDIRNVFTSSLDDGGAIYVLGGQGSKKASTISGNYIENVRRGYGAIYLDSGASHWLVNDNVVMKTKNRGWLFMQNINGHGMAWSNMVVNNFADTSYQQVAPLGTHATNQVSHNKLGLRSLTSVARVILKAAGL